MRIDWEGGDTIVTTLPGQEKQLHQFLEKSGFEPSEVHKDKNGIPTITVNKEFNLYEWDPKWEFFMGYTPIFQKLMDKVAKYQRQGRRP
jgi:hypothetical protein